MVTWVWLIWCSYSLRRSRIGRVLLIIVLVLVWWRHVSIWLVIWIGGLLILLSWVLLSNRLRRIRLIIMVLVMIVGCVMSCRGGFLLNSFFFAFWWTTISHLNKLLSVILIQSDEINFCNIVSLSKSTLLILSSSMRLSSVIDLSMS